MKRLLYIIIFCAGLLNVSAQEQRKHCFTDEVYREDILKDPMYAKNQADLETFTREFMRNKSPQITTNTTGTVYIIPVVFHIIHIYGPENISDAQCIDAVNIMTRDFRKRNADTIDIRPSFQGQAVDAEIEFRLASLDPNGNCTNGIEHIYSPTTMDADENAKLNPWPCNKYMNIWVINNFSLAHQGAAAYAHLPGGAWATDGIISRYDYVGSIGTSDVSHSRTLTHEMGHCFNLLHVWGNTNSPGVACGDDGVADTPISFGWDQCVNDVTAAHCNPPIIENIQNYMEYSYCDVMFTQGQVDRMRLTLTSVANGRNNLWTNTNLVATGTDGSPVTVCIPVADFKSDYTNVCANTPVQFYDQSWRAPITSWNWTFTGGNPATSTDSSPSVSWSAAGIYDVTLTVTSTGGSDTMTRTSWVRVTGPSIYTIPWTEDFEVPTSFPGSDGYIENPDNSASGLWTRVGSANTTAGGASCIKMNNFSNVAGQVDAWITPSFDFSNVTHPILITFQLANAQRNATSDDRLKILYSDNCGKTWHTGPYDKHGATLATSAVTASNFTPTLPSQWRLETANVNPVAGKPGVRFKFENTSDRGNNIYIDDINITGTITAIDENDEFQTSFGLYPNPTSGITNLNFALNKTSHVVIEVKGILGQTISTVIDKSLPSGEHNQKLPVLSSGIYLIDVIVNDKHHIRRLIVS